MDPVPPQIVGFAKVAVMAGLVLTVTVLLAVFVQPVAVNVADTVYVVLTVGAAPTTDPVAEESAVVGLQEYVSAAPVTVNTAESTTLPRQQVPLLTVICGRGLTMMRIVLTAEVQLLAVAVTLSVAVCTEVVLFTVVKLAM